ncbi:MAG: hypothetical protein ACXWCY_23355 [Burkholderiales bacterium]
MGRKKMERMLNAEKALAQRPRWAEAVIPVFVGQERQGVEMLRARANGDIYYYGKLIGNDEDVAAALIDIVNSHGKTLGGASEQAACWAVTELIRRKSAGGLPVAASVGERGNADS